MKINFGMFAKKHWWLMLTLLLMLVIPMVIFCAAFWKDLCDVSAWASLTAGVFTYTGAALLGVLTYYNTWSQNKHQEFLEEVQLEVSLLSDFSGRYFIAFAENELPETLQSDLQYFEKQSSTEKIPMNYLSFDISNLNPFVSTSFSIIGMYYVNERNTLSKVNHYRVRATQDPRKYIDYKQTTTCYIGCSTEFLKTDYYNDHPYSNWFVILKLTTSKNKSKYLILDYVLGQTLGVRKQYLSEKEYQKRIKQKHTPLCLDSYNAQFFRKDLDKS